MRPTAQDKNATLLLVHALKKEEGEKLVGQEVHLPGYLITICSHVLLRLA
jgi:hypothetical protein